MTVESMVRTLVAKRYERARGFSVPSDVPTKVLMAVATRKAFDRLRGELHSRRYGTAGSGHFRGARTSVRFPDYLVIGDNVVFGDDVLIDGFGRMGIALGDRVTVGSGTRILVSGVVREPGEGVRVGERVAIGMSCLLWGQGGISIGRDTLFGPNVTVLSENHGMDPGVPIIEQAGVRAPVTVGADCWIGANSTLLAGVAVGDGAIVAAGAVVTRSVEAGSIVAGVPAKPIGRRGVPRSRLGRLCSSFELSHRADIVSA